ncbi:hypothetical protein EKO27_g3208 [Xylaria grammica]|uniref:DNA/RNA-binding domain-containing protein n=1 Tax=Xylaria grammica TaxID=363999 RepID=A0A439DBW3_9PEZI|nr:hypothetical protein EKO27_g3208 [Xylaria grammica]
MNEIIRQVERSSPALMQSRAKEAITPKPTQKATCYPPPERLKVRQSPVATSTNEGRTEPPPRRSRARPKPSTISTDPDFSRGASPQGKLWDPNDDPIHPRTEPTPKRLKTLDQQNGGEPTESCRLIKQPETRPISQEQLVAEVKGIYAGLMMVESKCIEVDNAQSSQSDTKLNNEQWQALASQHPSASPALRRLAAKYAMPARLWRHGIHSFLELLRHRLPGSLEHMLTFIYLAYSMMALLYETVPAFEDTWIECLGDLGRYRMAIEDDDIRDREVWASVSRHWYSKASDKAPTTGRLYHHLAILARPNAVQQLFYYTKALCVPIPFSSAKESILSLFDPVLHHRRGHPITIDEGFVKTHSMLPSSREFSEAADELFRSLDNQIGRVTKRWLESGYYKSIANCCSLLPVEGIRTDKIDDDDKYFDRLWYPHTAPRNASNSGWPFYFGSYERASKSIIRRSRRGHLSLKHAALCVFLWLRCAAGAAITTNSASYTVEPSAPPEPMRQRDNGNWTWLLWPAFVVGSVFWVLATVRVLGQPLLFHGVSMGIFGVGYLLMVFNSEVSFNVQFSTWLGCAAFTAKWIRCDIQGMSTESKRVIALALVVSSLFLDLGIVSAFGSGDDLATNKSQSKPFFCCRSLYNEIVQRNVRALEQQGVV